MSGFERISAEQAELLLAENDKVMLLDMRDAATYCQGHDPRAVHLSDLNLRTLLRTMNKQTHLIFCCHHGEASPDMAELFAEFGFEHAYSLDGGYAAWQARPGRRSRVQAARPLALAAHY